MKSPGVKTDLRIGPMKSLNYPLYIKASTADNELKFYYTVHSSLDVIEEKNNSAGKNANDQRELYLGLLYPTEDYKVYPYDPRSGLNVVSRDVGVSGRRFLAG
ncbi:hypothetical protein DPMN_175555 [Dreissena polymorpha]|uniref:Uncharacterized protein n=1 Tax=Dreissena polymorpha TaxID=45954 RepID=A0A9D4E6Q9_DREPO|nr:hypothetical protein DPMN_175555 [Dreissena polymorpha]